MEAACALVVVAVVAAVVVTVVAMHRIAAVAESK
jgi:hypothetical protein